MTAAPARPSTPACRLAVALVVATLLWSMAAPPAAAADDAPEWRLDAAASRLLFIGTQGGSRFEGRFERFGADIRFDPANPERQRIRIDIDMASAKTGSRDRDETVKDAAWFDVARHPTALFTTQGIREAGPGRYLATAVLTLRGVSRPVELPFSLALEGDAARAEGEVTIDRTDFGVGQGEWASGDMVGRPVIIRFDIAARRAG